MKKSRAYRATHVKNVCLKRALARRDGQPACVGLDMSKEHVLSVLRWGDRDFERPWKAGNPFDLAEFVELLVKVAHGREMIVALEPTGTYGDPLRQRLADAGLTVHRVSPKASHDYAEIFDGVPSQHDGKDAAIVAELAALGKSKPWPFEVREWDQHLSYLVDWIESQRRLQTTWFGRLEGLLSRHWPEATRTLPLSSGVLLRCLAAYGGPAGLAADAAALDQLRRWGQGRLKTEKAGQLLADAQRSMGVRATEFDVRRIQQYAEEAIACRRKLARPRRN